MKEYRDKEIKNLIYLLFFLFLIWCTPALTNIQTTDGQSKYAALSAIVESTVISAILSCASVLFDCILSSNLKDKLVGLFFIPRAGETIFSKIKAGKVKDDRFRQSDAVSLYADIIQSLPSDKTERRELENITWYRIYQKYQEKGQVSQSQRDYLMCRDLYVETLVFLLIYILSLYTFPSTVILSMRFIKTLFVLAVAFNICTHLKMKRFVTTVIAVDVAKRLNEKESVST